MKKKFSKGIMSIISVVLLSIFIVTPIINVTAKAKEVAVYNFENYGSEPLDTEKFLGSNTDRKNGFYPQEPDVVYNKAIHIKIVTNDSAPNRPTIFNGEKGNYRSLKVSSPADGSFFRIILEDRLPFEKVVENGSDASLTFWAKAESPVTLIANLSVKDNLFGKEITIDSKKWKQYSVNLREMKCRTGGNTFNDKDFLTITKEKLWDKGAQEAYVTSVRFDTIKREDRVDWCIDTIAFEGNDVAENKTTMNYNGLGAMPSEYAKPDSSSQDVSSKEPGASSSETPPATSEKPEVSSKPTVNTENKTSSASNGNLIITDTKTNISIEAGKDVLPKETNVKIVEITSGLEYTKAKSTLSSREIEKFKLFDISVTIDDRSFTFEGTVKVSIPIPNDFDAQKVAVYRLEPDGTITPIKSVLDNGNIYFETEHFSHYIIAEVGEKENIAETETKSKNSPMKLWVLIAVVVATILIVGGLLYYILVVKKKDAAKEFDDYDQEDISDRKFK
ncbi:MAG: hypothetical protein RR436_02830 [Clostridia bacterium]